MTLMKSALNVMCDASAGDVFLCGDHDVRDHEDAGNSFFMT